MSGKFTGVIWTSLLERERVFTFSTATGTAELYQLYYVNLIFFPFLELQ